MTIDLRTASVDEMRDWLAEQQGWSRGNFEVDTDEIWRMGWVHPNLPSKESHPIPATLDAIVAVWRTELVGWGWTREYATDRHDPEMGLVLTWIGTSDEHGQDTTKDTGDELADRMRLTCLALAAERGIK